MSNLKSTYESSDSRQTLRQVQRIDLYSSTTLKNSPAEHRDPIMGTFFASYFASVGLTGSFFGVGLANALGAATAALVTTAVTPGLVMIEKKS